jgi:hypothetical protein
MIICLQWRENIFAAEKTHSQENDHIERSADHIQWHVDAFCSVACRRVHIQWRVDAIIFSGV